MVTTIDLANNPAFINPRSVQKRKAARQEIYKKTPDFFADVNGLQYGLEQIELFPPRYFEAIQEAMAACTHIYERTYELMMLGSLKDFLNLGFTEEFFDYVKVTNLSALTFLGRFDFSVNLLDDEVSIKVIELNADTPLLIMEAFQVNQMMCEHYNVENPNKDAQKQLSEGLFQAFQETIAHMEAIHGTFNREPYVVFASSKGPDVPDEFDDSVECVTSTKFLQSLFKHPSDFYFMEDLRVIEEDGYIDGEFYERGLYSPDFKKIDVLFRETYPAEFFPEDVAEDGTIVGHVLMRLAVEGRVGLINPPSAFAIQSKAIMGLIWGLMEQNLWFTPEECEIIRRYFLPTYLGNHEFIEKEIKYVQKSTFGRNGDTIKIYNSLDDLYYSSIQNSYSQYEEIFQAYTELPTATIHTDRESKISKYIVGGFTVMGKPSAIALRVGNEIIDDECYYLPCGISNKDK